MISDGIKNDCLVLCSKLNYRGVIICSLFKMFSKISCIRGSWLTGCLNSILIGIFCCICNGRIITYRAISWSKIRELKTYILFYVVIGTLSDAKIILGLLLQNDKAKAFSEEEDPPPHPKGETPWTTPLKLMKNKGE